MATDIKESGRNPKRVQREVWKQVQNTGIGTKTQQALKLQQEQSKSEKLYGLTVNFVKNMIYCVCRRIWYAYTIKIKYIKKRKWRIGQ